MYLVTLITRITECFTLSMDQLIKDGQLPATPTAIAFPKTFDKLFWKKKMFVHIRFEPDDMT